MQGFGGQWSQGEAGGGAGWDGTDPLSTWQAIEQELLSQSLDYLLLYVPSSLLIL